MMGSETRASRLDDEVQSLGTRVRLGRLVGDLFSGALASAALKLSSSGASFLTSLLLARFLGASGYGTYAYAMACVGLLGTPFLGLDSLLVRYVVTYESRSAWGSIRGVLRRTCLAILFSSLFLAFGSLAVAWLLARRFESQTLVVFCIALLSLPLAALTRWAQGAIRGFHRVVLGYVPEMVLRPLLFGALISGGYVFLRSDFSAAWAVGFQVIAAAIALLWALCLLKRARPDAVRQAAAVYDARAWIRSALSLVLVSGIQGMNSRIPTIILGAVENPDAVGVYAAASQWAQQISFLLLATNMTLGPALARLYQSGDIKQVQSLVTRSARMAWGFSLPVAGGLILWGDRFLSLFGADFVAGWAALVLLSVGELVNAGAGSVGLLLIMTGNERDVAVGIGISTALNLLLSLLLVPVAGIEGAAIASMSSLIGWNLLLAVFVHRRLGITSGIFGDLGGRWKR